MATPSASATTPKWIIDLHGVKEALTTRSNARANIIDAIQRGEMLVIRSVQRELSSAYPGIWSDFAAIKPKKYLDTSAADYATAAQIQETHGSSVLGGVPNFAHFEAIALARSKKCKLISAGKALAECKGIASKCGLPKGDIGGIGDV